MYPGALTRTTRTLRGNAVTTPPLYVTTDPTSCDSAYRQADAALANNHSDASTRLFGGDDDPRYFTPHRIQQRNRLFALKNLFRVIDNYLEGQLYIGVTLRRKRTSEDFNVVFCCIRASQNGTEMRPSSVKDFDIDVTEPNSDQVGMLFGVCENIHGPEDGRADQAPHRPGGCSAGEGSAAAASHARAVPAETP